MFACTAVAAFCQVARDGVGSGAAKLADKHRISHKMNALRYQCRTEDLKASRKPCNRSA